MNKPQGYILRLHKLDSSFNGEPKSEDSQGAIRYSCWGYYDCITLIPFLSVDDLSQNQNVPNMTEQNILFCHQKSQGMSFMTNGFQGKPPILIISFVMIEGTAANYINPFDVAIQMQQDLETKLGAQKDVTVHTFATGGASAICIIFELSTYSVASIKASLDMIRVDVRVNNQWIPTVYTFSLIAFDENHKYKEEKPFLDGVRIFFVAKPKETKNLHFFIDEIFNQLNQVSPSNDRQAHSKLYQATGADDYCLEIPKISLPALITLYGPQRIFAEHGKQVGNKWYGHYCESMNTSVFFQEELPIESSETGMADQNIKMERRKNQINKQAQSHIQSIQKYYPQIALFLQRHVNAFQAFRDSSFTKWIYECYMEIVNLYLELVKDELLTSAPKRVPVSHRSLDFFRDLEYLLESMHNTSICFTDAPGYKFVEDSWAPRILVAYSNLMNQLACNWDEAILDRMEKMRGTKGDTLPRHIPKHLFVIALHGCDEVMAFKECRDVPPDKRLIHILIPLRNFYQPAVLLPLIMHEAGHFIGVRHRTKDSKESKKFSRRETAIWLIVNQICASLYRNVARKKNKGAIDFGNNNMAFLSDMEMDEMDKVLLAHIMVLLKDFRDQLYVHISDLSEKITKNYAYDLQRSVEEEAGSEIGLIKHRKEMNRRSVLAYTNAYLKYMIPVLGQAAMEWMSKGEEALCKEVQRYVDRFSAEVKTPEALRNDLQAELTKSLLEIRQDIRLQTNWQRDAQALLSEPTADIFMISTLEMDVEHYLLLVFEQWCAPEITEQAITYRLGAVAAQCRILAILNVLHERGKEIPEIPKEDLLNEFSALATARLKAVANNCNMSFQKVAQLYIHFLKETKGCYDIFMEMKRNRKEGGRLDQPDAVELYDMMNMFLTIADYVQDLADDKRYTNMESENIQVFEMMSWLRRFYQDACKSMEVGAAIGINDIFKTLYEYLKPFSPGVMMIESEDREHFWK